MWKRALNVVSSKCLFPAKRGQKVQVSIRVQSLGLDVLPRSRFSAPSFSLLLFLLDLLKRKQVFSPITPQPQDISIPGMDFPPFSQFCPLVAEPSRPAHSTIFIPGEVREHLLCTLQGWSQTQLASVPNMQPGGFADSRVPGIEQIKLKMAALTPQQEDRELKPSKWKQM